jgi:hypothetical protein
MALVFTAKLLGRGRIIAGLGPVAHCGYLSGGE